MRGRLITLEGGEGAGKSTQARLLADALRARGRDVVLTREPGGSPGAERIRELLLGGEGFDPLAETLLHAAARAEHVATTIRPALERGADVVCDRFCDSTVAYQHFGQGAPLEAVRTVLSVIGLVPDRTLVLDVPPETGRARLTHRPDRYEREDAAFHARVRDGFVAIARDHPGRCALIDASGDQASVAAAILVAIEPAAPGSWTIAATDDPADKQAIGEGLDAFNRPALGPEEPFVLAAKAPDGRLLGGLYGAHDAHWMFVAWLWVHEAARASGVGRALMAAAEARARAGGCSGVYLDTFSFQAPGFYRKLGFEAFGRLDLAPSPHSRFWFSKRL